jgi:hypothetical protein
VTDEGNQPGQVAGKDVLRDGHFWPAAQVVAENPDGSYAVRSIFK